jgi:hypothetical protein
VSVIGSDSLPYLKLDYIISTNINRGKDYRLRYRSKNAIGWSGYSPIVYVLSAAVPIAPPQPERVSTTSTQINLRLPRSTDD